MNNSRYLFNIVRSQYQLDLHFLPIDCAISIIKFTNPNLRYLESFLYLFNQRKDVLDALLKIIPSTSIQYGELLAADVILFGSEHSDVRPLPLETVFYTIIDPKIHFNRNKFDSNLARTLERIVVTDGEIA